MEEDKRVEERLLAKGIREYKIIRTILKSLQYREYFGKISITDLLDDKMLVLFKTEEGIAQFTVSSFQSDNIIDTIIETSIKNTTKMSLQLHNDNFNNVKIEKNENYDRFYSFSENDYIMWINEEMDNVLKEIKLPLNTLYKVNINKYCLRTNKDYLEQYNANSEFICMENTKFKRKAKLSNIFLKDDIASSIIKNLNKIEIPINNINLNQKQRILIKSEGVSDLLNVYILMYYSNYVYLNQSFIKTNYIGKQISKSDFDLIVIPYNGIKFDGEGSRIFKKVIVDSGKLVNLLSNNCYSEYLNLDSFGNASLDMPNTISHQRLIFTFKNSERIAYQAIDLIIYQFEYVYIDFEDNEFTGSAICSDKSGYFRTTISFNIRDIFDNIYPAGSKSTWINNVYCEDIIILR
ncbi:metallopeptidase TldD-related protein [Clostridium botulinum]|uniref:metallopeptidase TldD-related protein n=1 Tax=Clostridium botulinum TaxID=1491 RepID=UPI0024913423|nr:metallopeptidase TldD-related protein [Clostridium botulinum]BDB03817.1 PmbA family protein [Clostridium botulinum]